MPTIPDNSLEIVPTQDGSDSKYILRDKDDDMYLRFDYTGRVSNGDRPEAIAFYKNGLPIGSFKVRLIDATVNTLNETLYDDNTFEESEL